MALSKDKKGVTGHLKHYPAVKIIDASPTKVTIQTSHSLPLGADYQFRLRSGSDVQYLSGRVMWCSLQKPVVNPDQSVLPVYHVGLHIQNLSEQDLESLENFLADSMMITLKNKLFGGIELTGEEGAMEGDLTASMDSLLPINVIKLGSGGMKVLSPLNPDIESEYEMEIILSGKTVRFVGKIKNADSHGQQFLLKVIFSKISEENAVLVRQFLQEHRKNKA